MGKAGNQRLLKLEQSVHATPHAALMIAWVCLIGSIIHLRKGCIELPFHAFHLRLSSKYLIPVLVCYCLIRHLLSGAIALLGFRS